MRIEGINPGNQIPNPVTRRNIAPGTQAPSFQETLKSFLNDANETQGASGAAKKKLLTGEITDVHQVMNKSNEAKVAFNLVMEIRNKTLEAYNEVMRMRL
jgi:flagellar hook-basal body complex protein FliE